MDRDLEPIVVFDLDGTITRSDTLLPFLFRAFGALRTGSAFLAVVPRLVRGLVDPGCRDAAKAALLMRVLAGQHVSRLVDEAESFADEVVRHRLRRGTLERIRSHRDAGHRLVLASASPELYVVPLARRLGFDTVIATRMEVDAEGRLSGRLAGENCRGAEKVDRLRELLGEDVRVVTAYGDSRGDREMLALARDPVWVGRRRRRRRTAGG